MNISYGDKQEWAQSKAWSCERAELKINRSSILCSIIVHTYDVFLNGLILKTSKKIRIITKKVMAVMFSMRFFWVFNNFVEKQS